MQQIRTIKKLSILEKYNFRINTPPNVKLSVNWGDRVNLDTVLGYYEKPVLLEKINIAEKLKINPKQARKFINVISGERLDKGDVVARKQILGGLGYYEAQVSVNGYVDLEDLDEGVVKICEYRKLVPIQSNCEGVITSIVPDEFIEIETRVLCVRLFENNIYKDVYSNFYYLNSSKLKLHLLDIENNIIFLDGNVTEEELTKIVFSKPKLIVLPTFDYIDMQKFGKNLILFWGYGKMRGLNKTYRNILSRLSATNANYSRDINSLVFPINHRYEIDEQKDNVDLMNKKVIVLNKENRFEEGRIVDLTENEAKVRFENKSTSYINFFDILVIN